MTHALPLPRSTLARALRLAALAGTTGALLLTLGCSDKADEPVPRVADAPYANPTPKANDTMTGQAATLLDDSAITTKVKTALLAEDKLKSLDISVETVQGQVTLSGQLDSQEQVDDALRVTRAIEGARTVQDLMTVKK